MVETIGSRRSKIDIALFQLPLQVWFQALLISI